MALPGPRHASAQACAACMRCEDEPFALGARHKCTPTFCPRVQGLIRCVESQLIVNSRLSWACCDLPPARRRLHCLYWAGSLGLRRRQRLLQPAAPSFGRACAGAVRPACLSQQVSVFAGALAGAGDWRAIHRGPRCQGAARGMPLIATPPASGCGWTERAASWAGLEGYLVPRGASACEAAGGLRAARGIAPDACAGVPVRNHCQVEGDGVG